jgi:sugar phosphate isomerase/epimerase
VSLYSFQEEYFLRKMSLEDIIATCEKLDIPGIEIIGEQMVPGFPEPGEAFFEQWHEWMRKYGRTPVCHDMFLDWNIYKDRKMTEDEMLDSVVRDLRFANRLGCKVIRVIHNTEVPVLERAVPFAEELDVKMGIEIHAPHHFEEGWFKERIALMERLGSPYLGFTPDMGIFTRRFPRVTSDRLIRNGAHENIVKYVIDKFNNHDNLDNLADEVEKMGANDFDREMARMARFQIYENPQRLLEFMPHFVHIHAKFYEMLPDYTEYSIAYDEVVPVLIEGGYNGYLSSEYEGNRHIQGVHEVDSTEQVRREQEMFKQLLGETR